MLQLLRRLTAFFRRDRLDQDLSEEISLHLALRRQALIDQGMDPIAADAEARRLFGNVMSIGEATRDERGLPSLASFLQDIRVGIRVMARSPGFSLAVVLTIAVGAGLNCAVFLLFNAAILRTPEVVEAKDVVRIDDGASSGGKPFLGVTYPDFVDYRDRAASALDIAAHSAIGVTARYVLGSERREDHVTVVLSSGNYFDVLRVRAKYGRTFGGADDLPPLGAAVVVLGEAYWARRFNRDPNVVGRTIELSFQPFTIIGILPAEFREADLPGFGRPFVHEMWVPLWCRPRLQPGDDLLRQRTAWWGLRAIGRLKPGVTLEQARAQIATAAVSLDREYSGLRRPRTPSVMRITDFDLRLLFNEAGVIAAVMGTSTLLVLLIGCANVGSLILARACSRSREVAVRLSLGAGRARIVRQFLTESLILAAGGTALGLIFAIWALWVGMTSADAQPLAFSLTPDLRVFAYAAVLAGLVTAVTGLAPAIQASKPGVLPGLKDADGGYRMGKLRAAFVAGEVGLCLVLLVMTVLLLRGVQRAKSIDPVLPVSHLLAVSAENSALHRSRAAALLAEVQRRIGALPGVTSTALASPLPFSGNRAATTIRRLDAPDAPGVRVFLSNVTPSFFTVANLQLLRGRPHSVDSREEIVVNQSLAAQLWGDTDPVGQRVTSGDVQRRTHVVVGVVRDSPFVSLRQRDEPFLFRAIDPAGGGTVVARTAGPAAALVRAAAAAVENIDARLDISVRPIAQGVVDEIESVGRMATSAAVVGLLALVLSLIGIASVTAHAVVQRTHEIGVRIALGANTTEAITLLVRRTLGPVTVGIVMGGLAATLLSRVLASQLYGLSAIDPIAFLGTSWCLIVIAAIASYLPARRAARVDPIVALRCE
jgi:macrolide transport system ATP-binding/permease protein